MINNDIFKTVVKIITSSGTGSGFYLHGHGITITNHHVVKGHRAVAIETYDREKHLAHVVLVHPQLDLAFLKTTTPLNLPMIELNTQDVVAGEQIFVWGFPYGMPFTVTEGIVSSPNQLLNGQRYIQTDAAVNPGNSGGPIVNHLRQIVGVATSKFSNADNIGFALPATLVANELSNFTTTGLEGYSVKCPSCNNLIHHKTEYCDNCGIKLDVDSLFNEVYLTPFAQFIEQAICDMGLEPITARSGPHFWELHKNRALIRIFQYSDQYLYALSPLVKLPKDNLLSLYEFILETRHAPFKLGVSDGLVYISYRVHLADLNSKHNDEIRHNIVQLSLKANVLNNELVEKYGCSWPDEAKL